ELGLLAFAVEAPPLAEARASHAAAPEDPGAAYAYANALAAEERWEEALDLFLFLVKKHRAWGDDAGRKAMLRVFDVVGIRSPLADTWRRRLSMELYK
ncbi:MAG: tetratricopeptide repeat protein, partial [Myxococcota bacterium]